MAPVAGGLIAQAEDREDVAEFVGVADEAEAGVHRRRGSRRPGVGAAEQVGHRDEQEQIDRPGAFRGRTKSTSTMAVGRVYAAASSTPKTPADADKRRVRVVDQQGTGGVGGRREPLRACTRELGRGTSRRHETAGQVERGVAPGRGTPRRCRRRTTARACSFPGAARWRAGTGTRKNRQTCPSLKALPVEKWPNLHRDRADRETLAPDQDEHGTSRSRLTTGRPSASRSVRMRW